MTDLVIHSDQSPATTPPPLSLFQGGLPEQLQLANALSKAHDLLPRSYHNNPGACLLLIDYAERLKISILEAGGNVSFNRGRATVGARLQRNLAARHGYRTQKVDGTPESCTVAVYGPDGTKVGDATYTYAQAEALGIIYLNGQSGELKQTWKGDPAQMLFHRATTRALDHYGPGEYAVAFADDDVVVDPDPDPVATISAATAPPEPIDAITLAPPDTHTAPPPPAPEPPATFTPDIPDRAPEPQPEATEGRKTGDELRALITGHPSRLVSVPKGIRATHEAFPDADLADYDKIAAHDGAHDFTLDWIARGGKDQ
ncbi:MAG: hypothetical protein GY929_20295 [Actinomycetia bacterium]|nr:hypothetical protein [Actinomycetes bacterium]